MLGDLPEATPLASARVGIQPLLNGPRAGAFTVFHLHPLVTSV